MKAPQSSQVQSPTAQLFSCSTVPLGQGGMEEWHGSGCVGEWARWSARPRCPKGHWLKHASANCSTVAAVCALHLPEQASACEWDSQDDDDDYDADDDDASANADREAYADADMGAEGTENWHGASSGGLKSAFSHFN